MDPALPYYENASTEESLTKESAKMVEVIHTNGGNCGIMSKVGHLDFYVNGGSSQLNIDFDSKLLKMAQKFNVRSHILAFAFYIESINCKKGFYGRLCISQEYLNKEYCKGQAVKMGGFRINETLKNFDLSGIKEGSYYVKTNEKHPHDRGLDF